MATFFRKGKIAAHPCGFPRKLPFLFPVCFFYGLDEDCILLAIRYYGHLNLDLRIVFRDLGYYSRQDKSSDWLFLLLWILAPLLDIRELHWETAAGCYDGRTMKLSITRQLTEVNKELWLLLSMFVIAFGMDYLVVSDHIVLGFYTLPTLYSAYFYGRRHATLTAFASVLVVTLVVYVNPLLLTEEGGGLPERGRWYELVGWGGILVITAYAMGTLYDHKSKQLQELRETYNGVLIILRQFISKDKYTQNHSYRVSLYATKIATQFGLSSERVEDVRAAALLHDIGKLDISRQILYKAARLSPEECQEMSHHVEKGAQMLEPVGGSLQRVIPIVLAHHDKFDGSGYHPTRGKEIPLAARIISVADVYDSLSSDRPYRKAMVPLDAKETIVKSSGSQFDPKVVEAFVALFESGQMEIPDEML